MIRPTRNYQRTFEELEQVAAKFWPAELSDDLVVTDSYKHVAIEVSFQVTTNSTIERKSGQAKSRYEQIEEAGHKIAYVIDGSGNFQRETALRVICAHSHCTVAFTRSELDVLCDFLREYFTGA